MAHAVESTAERLQTLAVAGAIGFGAFALGNVVVLLAASVLESAGVSVLDNTALVTILGTILIQGVTFGGIGLYFLRYRDGEDLLRVDWPSARELGVAAAGFVLLLALFLGIQFGLSAAGVQPAESSLASNPPWVLALLVPASLLVVGPGEELLFRGLVQGRLRRAFSAPVAITVTSVVFAAIHIGGLVGTSAGQLATVGLIFTLALVLGAAYEYTENLVVPSLMHGLFNATQFSLAYLAAVGAISL